MKSDSMEALVKARAFLKSNCSFCPLLFLLIRWFKKVSTFESLIESNTNLQ